VCHPRDPNLSSTLDVIEQSMDWIRSAKYDDSDIAESKISIFSEV
jgi:Zn-dependent M16 (insulinase) family peptidase